MSIVAKIPSRTIQSHKDDQCDKKAIANASLEGSEAEERRSPLEDGGATRVGR